MCAGLQDPKKFQDASEYLSHAIQEFSQATQFWMLIMTSLKLAFVKIDNKIKAARIQLLWFKLTDSMNWFNELRQ